MKILAFGDSILEGVIYKNGCFKKSKDSFLSICSNELNFELINKSSFGHTILNGEKIFNRNIDLLNDNDVKYVVFKYGGNDSNRNWDSISKGDFSNSNEFVPLNVFIEKYIDLINIVKEKGKIPVVCSLIPIIPEKFFKWISRNGNEELVLDFINSDISFLSSFHDKYNEELKRYCVENKTIFLDAFNEIICYNNKDELYCSDGIHLNEKGHIFIANFIKKSKVLFI